MLKVIALFGTFLLAYSFAGCGNVDSGPTSLALTDWSVGLYQSAHCERFVSFGAGGDAIGGTACYPPTGQANTIQIERGTYSVQGNRLVLDLRGACGEHYLSETNFWHPAVNELTIGTEELARREISLAAVGATVGCYAPDMSFAPLH